MTSKTVGCFLLFSILVLLYPAGTGAQQPGDIIPTRIVITFRDGAGAPQAAAEQLGRAHGAEVRHVFQHALRGAVLEVPAEAGPRILAALQRDARVRSAGFDRVATAFAQSVPKGINRINAEPATRANTGSNIRVAIVDSGLDFNHNDLAANIDTTLSRNCIGGCQPGGQDDNGHGTFVGGITAALDNTIDVVGVGPQITLIAMKVLNSSGSGSFGDISAACDYLAGLNGAGTTVHVANMSLGARCSVCTDDSTDPTISAFHDAVRNLVNSGTTVVVAAGNDGVDASTTVPASFDEVVTVSALADFDGQPGGNGGSVLIIGLGRVADDSFVKFSNHGADIDVIAPGVSETSLELGGGTSSGSGTSFSSPHAAGVAALFIRDQLNKTGSLPATGTVRQALIETGECAEGDGGTFHGSTGCSQVWLNDPDGIPEPLVRADNIANFSGGGTTTVHDVAVTSISAPSSTVVNTTENIEVGVANQGTEAENFTVTLSDNLSASISTAQNVSLAAGTSTTLTFSWTPTVTGTHTLTATASTVSGETDTADNARSQDVSVTDGSGGGEFTLTATGTKERGLQKADLSWSGAPDGTTQIDVFRDGVLIATTENDGAFRDDINVRGGGSYVYQVCAAGTTVCSNTATVVF